MNKNSSNLPPSTQTYEEIETIDYDKQRISVSLVGDTPNKVEKYSRLLIMDLDRLFHIVVNPPPDLMIKDEYNNVLPLTMMTLRQQWEWVLSTWQGDKDYNLRSLHAWFDDLVIVPERTEAGLIHFHCIARLNENKIHTDIARLFWNFFDIQESFKPSTAGGMKRFKEVTKAMVNVEPIRDEGIVKYLFHKDKKDYESLMHIKCYDTYPFKPIRLTKLNVLY